MREGKFCLRDEEIKLAEKRCVKRWMEEDPEATPESLQARSIPIKAYFENLPKRKPVLIIMLLEPIEPKETKDNQKALDFIKDLEGERMVAFAIGFPGIKETGKTKKYKVNKTYYQLNMQEPDETEDDEE